MLYEVTFSKYYTYSVEAAAYDQFESEMRYPVADTSYDEVEVKEQE